MALGNGSSDRGQLELALRPEADEEGGKSSSDGENGHLLGDGSTSDEEPPTMSRSAAVILFLADTCAFCAFLYGLLVLLSLSSRDAGIVWAVLFGLMSIWRIWRFVSRPQDLKELPFTAGVARSNGREVYLVATVHISPRSPKDVEDVIAKRNPDLVLIELDDERLDRMRAPDEIEDGPPLHDLQQISVWTNGASDRPTTIHAQRAYWNAEYEGDLITGEVVFDDSNPNGYSDFGEGSRKALCLVDNDSSEGAHFAPFSLKSHSAASSGAVALLIVDDEDRLPLGRIGGDSYTNDLRTAWKMRTCGFPRIPALMLPRDAGLRLKEAIESSPQGVSAELRVMGDHVPRRSLCRRTCHTCALIFSGIGILYGIIHCFAVEVGHEFLAAEASAVKRGVPCLCIDVNMDRFWGRLGKSLLPTPCNLWKAISAWMAFPRALARSLFPPQECIDVLGSIVLHAVSFKLRTWIAFIVAGQIASFITGKIFELLTLGAAEGGEQAGLVEEKDQDEFQAWIMLAIELYALPRLYEAVAASRDEAMYRGLIARSSENDSKRMVVVVGAGHANGILRRCRDRGL